MLDIDATASCREPDYDLIANIAQSGMPLCYGGGVHNVEQIEKIISMGVEKVSLGSSAVCEPDLIIQASRRVGGQSIAVLDVKKSGLLGYEVFTHNGTRKLTVIL